MEPIVVIHVQDIQNTQNTIDPDRRARAIARQPIVILAKDPHGVEFTVRARAQEVTKRTNELVERGYTIVNVNGK